MTRVAFVGMTHLGLVSGSASAAKGFDTLCVDPDAALIARIASGELPVREPGLAALIDANGSRQRFCANLDALANVDLAVIAPDAPTDDQGQSDLAILRALIEAAAPRLRPDAAMVILSQSPPGFTRAVEFPKARLFHQVETLVFGQAVERALSPERIIIGAEDPAAALPPAYQRFLDAFGCPLLPMRYESAELAKISINLCLLSSISVANTMAEICEAIGADWSEIAPALRLDRRIGQHAYLRPGLGVAGGNLERDMATTIALAERRGADSGVARAWIANSRRRRDWAAQWLERLLEEEMDDDPMIAVWGLAYKENTDATKNSPALATLGQFPTRRFRAHDPAVAMSVGAALRLERVAAPLEAALDAAALMVLTPWPEYRDVPLPAVATAMRGRAVIDPYSVFEPQAAAAAGLDHYSLGRPPSLGARRW